MAPTRIAVVTGGNKGIGFAIVEALCKQFDGTVILAARDVARGQEAVKELQAKGLHPVFMELDIDNESSIKEFAGKLKEQYGGLDVLVNNAAIAFKGDDPTPFPIQAETTIRVNFTGTLNASKHLFPLLRPFARVVHVSSRAGMLSSITNQDLRNEFTSDTQTVEGLQKLMQRFVDLTRDDSHKAAGWPNTAYGTSKIGVTALTRIQQRAFNADPREDIVVNACCPGYVDTDMTSHKGHKTPDQGAETPVYLALLPPKVADLRGEFVAEKAITAWVC